MLSRQQIIDGIGPELVRREDMFTPVGRTTRAMARGKAERGVPRSAGQACRSSKHPLLRHSCMVSGGSAVRRQTSVRSAYIQRLRSTTSDDALRPATMRSQLDTDERYDRYQAEPEHGIQQEPIP